MTKKHAKLPSMQRVKLAFNKKKIYNTLLPNLDIWESAVLLVCLKELIGVF